MKCRIEISKCFKTDFVWLGLKWSQIDTEDRLAKRSTIKEMTRWPSKERGVAVDAGRFQPSWWSMTVAYVQWWISYARYDDDNDDILTDSNNPSHCVYLLVLSNHYSSIKPRDPSSSIFAPEYNTNYIS